MKCRVIEECYFAGKYRYPNKGKDSEVAYRGKLEDLPDYLEVIDEGKKVVGDEGSSTPPASNPSDETGAGEGGESSNGGDVTGDLNARIQELAKGLDNSNDEHWTKDGKPAMKFFESALGTSLKRAEVEAALPELVRVKP